MNLKREHFLMNSNTYERAKSVVYSVAFSLEDPAGYIEKFEKMDIRIDEDVDDDEVVLVEETYYEEEENDGI